MTNHWTRQEKFAMKTLGNRRGYTAAYLERKVKEARIDGLNEALKLCWKVYDRKIGVHDQVLAFKLGHGQGSFECARIIESLIWGKA